MSHPRLAGLSPEQLAYRAIALCRIAQILDSVLYLVSGPSMLTDRTFAQTNSGLIPSRSPPSCHHVYSQSPVEAQLRF